MTIGRNRIESIDYQEKETADFFVDRHGAYGTENFVNEYRPVLANFLADILLYDTDIEAVLEETIRKFRFSRNTCVWHKTVNCRTAIGKILIETLLNRDVHRSAHRETGSDKTFVIDPGANNLPKRLAIAWRNHMIEESWHQLKLEEIRTKKPVYTVLLSRYEKPWLSNSRLLKELDCIFNMMPTKQAFRVFLIRCEQKLAKNVVGQVANTIHMPNATFVKSEMNVLDLSHFWERIANAPKSVRLSAS